MPQNAINYKLTTLYTAVSEISLVGGNDVMESSLSPVIKLSPSLARNIRQRTL